MITPEKATKLKQAWDCWYVAINAKLTAIENNVIHPEQSLYDVAYNHMMMKQYQCYDELDEVGELWLHEDMPNITFNR